MKKIYPAKSDEVQFVMTKNALFSNNYLEEQAWTVLISKNLSPS